PSEASFAASSSSVSLTSAKITPLQHNPQERQIFNRCSLQHSNLEIEQALMSVLFREFRVFRGYFFQASLRYVTLRICFEFRISSFEFSTSKLAVKRGIWSYSNTHYEKQSPRCPFIHRNLPGRCCPFLVS